VAVAFVELLAPFPDSGTPDASSRPPPPQPRSVRSVRDVATASSFVAPKGGAGDGPMAGSCQ
jgi:hypothetical protein